MTLTRVLPLALFALGVATPALGQGTLSVSGTVRTQAGAPLAGVVAQIAGRSATSNAQGAFRIDSVDSGRHLLSLRTVGYLPLRVWVVVTRDAPVQGSYVMVPAATTLPTLVVEANRTGIYGTVGDSAMRPLVGVKVRVAGSNGGEQLSDSAGRFAFPKANNGQFLLRVTKDGFAEQRLSLEMKRDEGRELAIRMVEALEMESRASDEAFEYLSKRLAANLRRERLGNSELERLGSLDLCSVNQITQMVGRSPVAPILLVLNGTTVIPDVPVYTICSWRADEVELVEFGSSICRDITKTIADLVQYWCTGVPPSGRRRGGRVSITGAPRIRTQGMADTPFVVIWEKR